MTPLKSAETGGAPPKASQDKARDNFYERAMSEAETEYLKRAGNMDGIDDEIAVLRAKLFTALEERPDDLALLMKGISTLSRSLAARHRLTGKAEKDLFDNLMGTLQGLSEQVFFDPDEGIEL